MAFQEKLIDALGSFATTFNSYRYIQSDQVCVYYLNAGHHCGGVLGTDLQYGAGSKNGWRAFSRCRFWRR